MTCGLQGFLRLVDLVASLPSWAHLVMWWSVWQSWPCYQASDHWLLASARLTPDWWLHCPGPQPVPTFPGADTAWCPARGLTSEETQDTQPGCTGTGLTWVGTGIQCHLHPDTGGLIRNHGQKSRSETDNPPGLFVVSQCPDLTPGIVTQGRKEGRKDLGRGFDF